MTRDVVIANQGRSTSAAHLRLERLLSEAEPRERQLGRAVEDREEDAMQAIVERPGMDQKQRLSGQPDAPASPSVEVVGERWELRLGARVENDGEDLGRVVGIALDRATGEVGHLVVARGILHRRATLVPAARVADAGEEVVRLVPPDHSRENPVGAGHPVAHADRLTITTLPRLIGREGEIGTIDLLLVDSTCRRVTDLVARPDGLASRRHLVPTERVQVAEAERIIADLDRAELDALPEYRSDEEIALDVFGALWDDEVTRRINVRHLQIDVKDGVVTIRGHVASSFHRARVAAAVRQVRGALDDQIDVIADDELEIAVAQALAQDPRTRQARILTRASHGVVHLWGEVSAVVSEVAKKVPGVRGLTFDGPPYAA